MQIMSNYFDRVQHIFATVAMAAAVAMAVAASPAAGQDTSAEPVGIISGGVTGTYARFAHQMSVVLDNDELRVLPILGKGSQQNVRDLLYMNGVDIAIVQSDVLDFYRKSKTLPHIEDSVRYITKLYNEEIHVVVPTGTTTLKEIEGGLVSVGGAGSGTEMTAINLFDALGVSVDPVNASNAEALEQVREGGLDAAVFVVGKPSSLIQQIGKDEGLALLPLTLPKTLQASFFDSHFSSADYPDLIEEGSKVPTIAVGAILAVFNWREESARFRALSKFSESLVEALPVLQGSTAYHPKWSEVDFSVEVPGWTRFEGIKNVIQ